MWHAQGMADDIKADLHKYLHEGREALVWKLDGLTEYDRRRPLTPTGTNLLGLVKHVAWTEGEYFSVVFDRPMAEPLPWSFDEAEDNADLWATPDESTDHIVGVYRRVWAHSDAVIEELSLDATGTVPWWPAERNTVTLHKILVHMVAETHRHAGHADIVRETVDGAVGLRQNNGNMPPVDEQWWAGYRDRVEQAAKAAG